MADSTAAHAAANAMVDPWPLSQGQLNTLTTCPRQFQYQFLEQRTLTVDPALQDSLEWGQRFHRLMERFLLGLSITPWLEGDRELANCFTAIQTAFPSLVPPHPNMVQLCEHRRSLQQGAYCLTAIYDLLILGEGQGLIIDWKTAARPRDRQDLKDDWQTQLYLYLLVETSALPPEACTMIYWFVRSSPPSPEEPPGQPTVTTFDYDSQWHQHIHQHLTRTLENLTDWRQDWLHLGNPFPQVPPDSHQCHYCTFASQCDRGGQPVGGPGEVLPSRPPIPPWETLPEINPNPL